MKKIIVTKHMTVGLKGGKTCSLVAALHHGAPGQMTGWKIHRPALTFSLFITQPVQSRI